jgi:hypothetical protein
VAPDGPFDDNAEALRDEIQGFTAGLLGLVGIDADPISSRESVLIANLIEHAWRNGQSLGIDTLLGWIQRPPIRKLGVFDVESFFPAGDRLELAMRLNGLLASPGFGTWMEGMDLDIPKLLWDTDGTPQAAIMYLAHLSDEERQFVVTLILSKLITWMRSQAGSGDLRVLAYMDEVFGFAPPTANPPAKQPILTLLKQARAFGVGVLLSTQNPVDLDYKAMSNAGTWCIGRLQTERDKARILEALTSVTGDVDVQLLDEQISGLAKRTFLLHNTRSREPEMFTTRWAMSYLRGPLTPTQIRSLTDRRPIAAPAPSAAMAAAPEAPPAVDGGMVAIMPPVADGIVAYHLDPAAAWAPTVEASASPSRYEAAAAVRVTARYDDTAAGVDHVTEWEAIVVLRSSEDLAFVEVDHDQRDFIDTPLADIPYVLPDARIDTNAFWSSLSSAIKERLYREGEVTVYKNASLKMYSRVGESLDEFAARCERAADDAADAATATLKDKYEKKLRRIQLAIDKYGAQAEAAGNDARSGDIDLVAGTVFDMLAGRSRSRSISSAAKSRRAAQRRVDTANERVDANVAEYEFVQAEFQEEVGDLVTAWDDKAVDIEGVSIGLEKNDITIATTALVWIPRA